MARALELAGRAKGRTSPNPLVGCVVVRDGQVIAEDYHRKAGQDHAEAAALKACGDAKGATIYISLEPCCFTGKTPPCIDQILEARPARVVVAMEDPNPKVSGRSVRLLRAAGIEVEVGVMEAEARKLNEYFVKYITTGRPFVIAKCAMTLDGKIATRTGDSKWVTSEAARLYVHRIRNEVDGILVGSRTVMLDDPSLTARLDGEETRDPIRIIVDSSEYLDSSRKVFHLESAAPTWVAAPTRRDIEGVQDIIEIPWNGAGVDFNALMAELGRREITSLLIEGGGSTHGSAFEAGVVDKVLFFVAPKIVGGGDAITAVEGRGIELMQDAIAVEDMTVAPIGPDFLFEGYVRKG